MWSGSCGASGNAASPPSPATAGAILPAAIPGCRRHFRLSCAIFGRRRHSRPPLFPAVAPFPAATTVIPAKAGIQAP